MGSPKSSPWHRILLFFWLLGFNCYASYAAELVNAEVHYIGKVVFPITGQSFSTSNQCVWEVDGGVTLILSFSRSTSLAAFFVKQNLSSTMDEETCPSKTFSSNFTFPLAVNASEKSYSASSSNAERSIQGSFSGTQVEGSYRFQSGTSETRDFQLNQLVNNNTSNWSGTFKTTLKEIPGEFIDVSKIKAM